MCDLQLWWFVFLYAKRSHVPHTHHTLCDVYYFNSVWDVAVTKTLTHSLSLSLSFVLFYFVSFTFQLFDRVLLSGSLCCVQFCHVQSGLVFWCHFIYPIIPRPFLCVHLFLPSPSLSVSVVTSNLKRERLWEVIPAVLFIALLSFQQWSRVAISPARGNQCVTRTSR